MKIGFGTVINFYDEKGFGFVSNIFDSTGSDRIFFHIKNIKKMHPRLSESIVDFGFPNNYRRGFLEPYWHEKLNISEAPFFWYEIEHSEKGDKVKNTLTESDLQNELIIILPTLIEKIELIWGDILESIPFHLKEVSEQLLGIECSIQLREKRELMIKQKQESLIERKKILDSKMGDNESGYSFEEQFEISIQQTKLSLVLSDIDRTSKDV